MSYNLEDDLMGFYVTDPVSKGKVVVENMLELEAILAEKGGAAHVDRYPLGPYAPMELIGRITHGDKSVTDYYATGGSMALVIRNLLNER